MHSLICNLAVACLALTAGIAGAGPGAAPGAAQDPFSEVVASRERAEAANAQVLAPQTYGKGVKALEQARKDAAAGRDPQRVAGLRDQAAELFRTATRKAAAAAATFDTALKSRDAAQAAEAPRLVPEIWQKAEGQFTSAARRLEDGDAKGAGKGGGTAEAAYRDAELQALRIRYLAGARAQLVAAEKARAERYAPKTLARAQALLATAESSLAGNRAQPDKAADAIGAANREARHAARVAELAGRVGDDGRTIEDLVLDLESTIDRMTAAAGLPAGSVAGDPVAADKLVAGVAALRGRAEGAERDLGERERQVAGLEDEIHDLDARLGGTAAERDKLVLTMAAEQRARELFATLNSLFTPAEGQVVRQGANIVLRLTGLPFRPGGAELRPEATPLLQKVQTAVALFPRADIVIEGHADGSASEEANRRLSEQRAEAVQAWLARQFTLPSDRIQATGYGASQPLAGSGPDAGRGRSRRIDIVITPNDGTPQF